MPLSHGRVAMTPVTDTKTRPQCAPTWNYCSGKSLARLRRVEMHFRTFRRIGIILSAVAILLVGAFFYQERQTREARHLAEENRRLALKAEAKEAEAGKSANEARENQYAADINLAQQAF